MELFNHLNLVDFRGLNLKKWAPSIPDRQAPVHRSHDAEDSREAREDEGDGVHEVFDFENISLQFHEECIPYNRETC